MKKYNKLLKEKVVRDTIDNAIINGLASNHKGVIKELGFRTAHAIFSLLDLKLEFKDKSSALYYEKVRNTFLGIKQRDE